MHLYALQAYALRNAFISVFFTRARGNVAINNTVAQMQKINRVDNVKRTAIVTLQNKRTGSSARGNGDRRQRDCGLRGSQNDAQRYARTQRYDVGHFLAAAVLARILIGACETARRGKKSTVPRVKSEYRARKIRSEARSVMCARLRAHTYVRTRRMSHEIEYSW